MNLFQLGYFTLNSGDKSSWKLECDALTGGDICCLARMIRLLVGEYSSVEGVPQGGLRLAAELDQYKSLLGPHLIVDDVLTTGGSLERVRKVWETREQTKVNPFVPSRVIGAVVFARGPCPLWIRALFQMPKCFWTKPMTRGSISC